jgi:hypothetical protein
MDSPVASCGDSKPRKHPPALSSNGGSDVPLKAPGSSPHSLKIRTDLSLATMTKPIAPEACSHPATPAVITKPAAWRPRCSRKAAPPPLTRIIVYTATNQRFESAYEYLQNTQDRRRKITESCFARSQNMDCREDTLSSACGTGGSTPIPRRLVRDNRKDSLTIPRSKAAQGCGRGYTGWSAPSPDC